MCEKLLLASASPRRLEILRRLGIEPEVMAVAVNEITKDLPPEELVIANARLKAAAAAKLKPARVILAADTPAVCWPRFPAARTACSPVWRYIKTAR